MVDIAFLVMLLVCIVLVACALFVLGFDILSRTQSGVSFFRAVRQSFTEFF